MSDILLNLDFSCAGGFGGTESEPHASSKHERFMRSRRYLERKGCLNKKQIPKHRQKHTQGQGQGQAQGQGQRLGQAQGQGQGQRLGQAQGQRLGQGQAQGQGQRLGQAQGQGQRLGQAQGQGQGQRLGQAQGQSLGQGQAQGQGQRLGQAQVQKLGQGQAQGQGQRLGQAQGQRLGQAQGQRLGQGQGQGQRLGQAQGQRLGQAQGQRLGQGQGQRLGQGQAKGQRQGQKLGQGQAQWQGQRLGQGQKQGKGQDQGQKQGRVQGRTPMPQYTPNHTPESPHPQQNGSRCTPAPSRPQLATSSASNPHPKPPPLSQSPPPTTASPAFQPPGAQLLSEFQSGLPRPGQPFKCVAVDCEMVGTGPMGKRSELARCSIVGYDGDVIYDQYILPVNRVTDYRSRWSGIRPHHLRQATPFQVAKKQIMKLLQGKVVVGHAIHNDFKALEYFHPPALTRDTSRIPLLNARAGLPAAATPSLKNLTRAILSRDIQVGRKGHSSVEDARATMELYKTVEVQWESTLARKSSTTQDGGGV